MLIHIGCCSAAFGQDPCDAAVLQPLAPPCATSEQPTSVADDTKAVLGCAWIETGPGIAPDAPDRLLEALRLLTSGPAALDVNQEVFVKLTAASPTNVSLFRAAMGEFDAYGPTAQGLPDLLDTLAKTNTLPKPSDENKANFKIALLACTQNIIDDLYEYREPSNPQRSGPSALARINDSFAKKNNYVGLYQLLDAVWRQNDARHLEKLRAAFDTNAEDLASQVAAKIKSPK